MKEHNPVLFRSSLALLLGLVTVAFQSHAENLDLLSVTDCRYLTTENPEIAFDSNYLGDVWFPEGDLFRPPAADVRQARFYTSGRKVSFKGNTFPTGSANGKIDVGIAGIGIDYGIWKRSSRRRCDGIRVGVTAIITSQFNLDSESDGLINSDFVIGPSVSLRRGALSARIRVYHQSSHLGDEFILQNPGFGRLNLSFEVIDALVSYEGPWWRVYGGGGYLAGAQPVLDPGILQWGFEFRSPRRLYEVHLTPVFAADFNSLESRDWDITTSLAGGVEMSNPTGTRRYRAQLVFLRGFIPFGQFFNTAKVNNYGIQFQFDY